MIFRWYESLDRHTLIRHWWTQRFGEKGICYDIKQLSSGFVLFRCNDRIGIFETLQGAIDFAENE